MQIRSLGRAVAVFASLLAAAACSRDSPTSPTPTPSGTTSLAGNWTVTIAASSICTQIPATFRQRTYAATITQSGTNVAVNLAEAQTIGFSGIVSGRTINWQFAVLTVLDTASSTIAITVNSTAQTAVSSNMSSTFPGAYDYVDFTTGRTTSCNAANHQLTFVRR